MKQPFLLSIIKEDNQKVINFANHSDDFVEVVFIADGKELKKGMAPDNLTRGYGYPPKLEKPLRRMKDGTLIRFLGNGVVKALVFPGVGSYKDKDLDKPTFMRHELVDKFSFKRTSDTPVAVLEVEY